MWINWDLAKSVITLLVGLTTIYGFITKFFADRQKKKLDEILQIVQNGFVSKPEYESFKGHIFKRVNRLELAVFMQKHPEFEEESK